MDSDPVKPIRLSGVDVCFPHEPYGVQKVFMAQVVRAIDHNDNALLEAPTGCGKTLSLLCGALAWQASAKAKRAAADQAAVEKAAAASKAATAHDPIVDSQDALHEAAEKALPPSPSKQGSEEPEEPIVVPKIYYATRTHSQIAQVVRELKRTIYKPKMAVLGARSHYCINQAVIRKGNIDAGCEELLKDGMGCKYKKNANSIGHGLVKVHDIEDLAKIGKRNTACPYFVARHLADSAELIFCPYSYLLDPNIRRSTRINASDAILIFDEAHNIEDQAREAGTMEIELEQLKGSVMALVMAANSSAEGDTYRELSDAVLRVINWMLALADGAGASGAPGRGFQQAGFESFERIWTGQQLLSALSYAGLGFQEVDHLWACYEKAKAAEERAGFNTEGEAALEAVQADVKTPRAGGNALGCVASMLSVLRLMYGTYTEAPAAPPAAAGAAAGSGGAAAAAAAGSSAAVGSGGGAAGGGGGSGGKIVQSVVGVDHVADYRLAVQMWLPRETNHNNRGRRDRRRPDPSTDGFAETTGCSATSSWAFRLCLWCLNPAVVFRGLSKVARSVLLTSGTLSPLDSFSGELGLDFQVRLEAPHVVDINKQVFSRVVSHGLEGRRLRATYKEADQLEYQDSLGQLLLATASTVPDGLLMFLPSYALMEKLTKRWQDTGLMAQLQRVKAVFSEPRQAGDAFDTAIRRYYEAVDEGQGGLFMAVCRGKVSEGIDFADGRARCVMVVGIPYPHFKDSKVALKKQYNNDTANASQRAAAAARRGPYGGSGGSSSGGGPPRLLTGEAWYSQQAFRALNQAIGRCIRHRLDYGAILLVDERFKEPRNQTSLSKWVRGTIKPADSTQALLHDMGAFFQGLAACPPGSAAAAGAVATPLALPAHVDPQPQQQLVKPGYEQQPGQLVKPGFESEPGVACGSGFCKPGFEPMAGYAGAGPNQGCCGAAGSFKPGYEPNAAAAAGAGGDARSRWQQPQLLPGGKQPWQQSKQPQLPPQQQQQQPKLEPPQQQQQQQGAARTLGPMDAFLVKAAAKQQQQQQQAPLAVKQEPPQHGPGGPYQRLPGGLHSEPKREGAAARSMQLSMDSQPQQQRQKQQPQQQQQHGQWQHQGQQQWQAPAQGQQQQQQQQQRPKGQAISCLTALQGMAQQPSPCTPAAPLQAWAQQQQGQQQQQQQLPLKPLDSNVASTPASSKVPAQHMCDSASKQHTSGPPPSGSKEHGTAAGAAAAGAPLAAAAAGAAVTPPPQQQQQHQQVAGATPGGTNPFTTAAKQAGGANASPNNPMAAAAAATCAAAVAAGGGVAAAEGSSMSSLDRLASKLGLSLQLAQQWVAADMGSMISYLQQQQAVYAAAGMQMQELASFGIMASFDKALEVCQQQQRGSNAAGSLAAFWPQWRSYVPTGLVAAAAAAGQHAPDAVVAQAGRGQWQGPWLQTMQQQELQQTLTAMAGLYDQLLEQQQQMAQGTDVQQQQLQQQQPFRQGQPPPCGQNQKPSDQRLQQQQQQQASHQGWPAPSRQDMPAPTSRPPPRTLPASLQRQPQQWTAQPPGTHAGSSNPANGSACDVAHFSGSAIRGPSGPSGDAGAGGSAGGAAMERRPQPLGHMQLSQSAQAPKRAGYISARAQVAAQKRSKGAAGEAVIVKPPPLPGQGAAAESSEDDDFL